MASREVLLEELRVALCAPHLVSVDRHRRRDGVSFWVVLDLGERRVPVACGNLRNPRRLNAFRYRRAWEAGWLTGERTSFTPPAAASAEDGRRIRRLMHEIADLDVAVSVDV